MERRQMAEEKRSDGANPKEEGHLDEESLRIVKESMERHKGLLKRLADH